ncbi:DUF3168 domain-containing protein [Planctomycetales bacterium ZRK34]|nr:DUF3168 domain-containing protein [Planctomycetales bacterium ZRK34]
MSIEESVKSIIAGDSAVSAITTTVKPFMLWRNDATPAVLYTNVSAQPRYHYGGNLNADTVSIQLDCMADTYREARELHNAVINSIDAYRGVSGDVEIAWAWFDYSGLDLPYEPTAAKETSTYRVQALLKITYKDNSNS